MHIKRLLLLLSQIEEIEMEKHESFCRPVQYDEIMAHREENGCVRLIHNWSSTLLPASPLLISAAAEPLNFQIPTRTQILGGSEIGA